MHLLACPLQRFGGQCGQPCGLLLVWKGCTRSAPSCHMALFEYTCRQKAHSWQSFALLLLIIGVNMELSLCSALQRCSLWDGLEDEQATTGFGRS